MGWSSKDREPATGIWGPFGLVLLYQNLTWIFWIFYYPTDHFCIPSLKLTVRPHSPWKWWFPIGISELPGVYLFSEAMLVSGRVNLNIMVILDAADVRWYTVWMYTSQLGCPATDVAFAAADWGQRCFITLLKGGSILGTIFQNSFAFF